MLLERDSPCDANPCNTFSICAHPLSTGDVRPSLPTWMTTTFPRSHWNNNACFFFCVWSKLVVWFSYFLTPNWGRYALQCNHPTRWEMKKWKGQRKQVGVESFLNLWNTLETCLCLGWKGSFNMFEEMKHVACPSQEESDLFEPQWVFFCSHWLLIVY